MELYSDRSELLSKRTAIPAAATAVLVVHAFVTSQFFGGESTVPLVYNFGTAVLIGFLLIGYVRLEFDILADLVRIQIPICVLAFAGYFGVIMALGVPEFPWQFTSLRVAFAIALGMLFSTVLCLVVLAPKMFQDPSERVPGPDEF